MTKGKAVVLAAILFIVILGSVVLAATRGGRVLSPVPEEPRIVWIKPTSLPTPTLTSTPTPTPTSKPKVTVTLRPATPKPTVAPTSSPLESLSPTVSPTATPSPTP